MTLDDEEMLLISYFGMALPCPAALDRADGIGAPLGPWDGVQCVWAIGKSAEAMPVFIRVSRLCFS